MSLDAKNYDPALMYGADIGISSADISIDDLTVADDAAIGGDLAVTGNSTLTGTLAATGATTLGTLLYKDLTETVAATNAIAAAESGSMFFLSSATEFVSTLPAPAAGLKYTFVVAAAPSGASYTIVTTSSNNIIKGQVFSGDLDAASDTDSETSGGDTISFVDSKAVAGDRVDVICDGTNWFAYGFCKAFDAITITTAS